MIDTRGLKKADVLAALYNASRPQGMGFLHYEPNPMTSEEAQVILDSGSLYFDYGGLYDRDNGVGSAGAVIALLRATGDTNNEPIAAIEE